MTRKTQLLAVFVAGSLWLAESTASHGSVYKIADGIVRPSAIHGAKEAYLPIILPTSHAANLLALPNGDLLGFWFSGSFEGRSGVSIVMSRLNHGSRQWTEPVILSHRDGWSNQNPAPFRAPDGRLWLFHTSQEAGKGQTTAQVFSLTSDDNGHTWTAPQLQFAEPGSFIRHPIVVFHDAWLLPMYHSASTGILTNAEKDHSMVKISHDRGSTWQDCEVPESGGVVQMDIVKTSEEHLLAFFRSRYADWIYQSSSTDGCHWEKPTPTRLPNNNASIQVARLQNGHLVVGFNNAQATSSGKAPAVAPRKILSVALSVDGGETWPWVRDVQAGETPPEFLPAEVFEYCYPSITQTPDGKIQLAFTFRLETIKYMSFDEQWIKEAGTAGIFKGDPKP